MKRLVLIPTALALLLGSRGQATAGGLIYDASLGTLPDAQGFNFVDTGGSPTPTVAGGILHQGLTSTPGLQYWVSTAHPGNFLNGFTMEANLQVISSTHGNPSRFGYYLDAGDSLGREFSMGFSSSGIAVNTDGTGSDTQGIPFTSFNTTNGFHDYKLVVSGGTGSLFIDSVFVASTPVNNTFPDTPNQVFFGDGSMNENSETNLKAFSYSFSAIPEPGSLILIGIGALSLLGYTRRPGKKVTSRVRCVSARSSWAEEGVASPDSP